MVAPVLDEEGALQGNALQAGGGSLSVSRPAEAAAVASSATTLDGISSVGVSSTEAAPASRVLASGLEDPSSSHDTLMGGQQVSPTATSSGGRSVGSLSALEAYSSILDSSILDSLTTTAAAVHDASSEPPLSSPFSGALPIPASGSASGGSAPSSGGTGHELGGALTFVLIALLAGKFLWYRRDFLKPDSPYGLIVNQPS